MTSAISETTPCLEGKTYYRTTSLCPHCNRILPAAMVGRANGVFVSRTCPEHGLIEGLACSDTEWFERLPKFDVDPVKPGFFHAETKNGCPQDCGLCPSHRQSAGTAAIEISNACNMACPVCLADNQGTFEMSPEEVGRIADEFLAHQPGVDAFTLSGGEPTVHPRLFDIVRTLKQKPGITRIVINSNGKRIAEDDAFLEELASHPYVYISLHHDGPQAMAIRGIDPALQEKALDRLLARNIPVVPLVLGVKDLTDRDLGTICRNLLIRSTAVKSIIISLMAYCGSRGSSFEVDPGRRLTIPEALARIEQGTRGNIRACDFMPLPMPNPLCAAIGYFIVIDSEITPLISLMDIDRVIEFTKNAHFVHADQELETLLKETIDRLFADPSPRAAKALSAFRRLVQELYPEGRALAPEERRRIAEQRIKTVYLMQFMDRWTFDSVRLSKCSCQHLLPEGRIVPSCGYYALHRGSDPRFLQHGA